MNSIQLQSVGKVPAVPASELKSGDVRMYNFGSTGLVVKVIEKTPKTLMLIMFEGGKYWAADIRKDTLVCIAKRDQDVSEHKPTEAYKVGRGKGNIDVGEYFQIEEVSEESTIIEGKEDNKMEQVLVFEGAGWEKAESSVKSGVGNCRIRTRIRNNEGRLIYLEMTGFLKSSSDKREILNGLNCVGHVSHCFYADSEWDSKANYSDTLDYDNSHFEYNKDNVIRWVNENLNCSFTHMEVINDNSVRVHDTKDPLCDCSNGDYVPYRDTEYNIIVLEGIKPIAEYQEGRHAQYRIGYEYIMNHKQLSKWIASRTEGEKAEFPNYAYYATLRWDENGNITSGDITARQNFVSMGLGLSNVRSVLDEIKRCALVLA